jgi:hypothetical protein
MSGQALRCIHCGKPLEVSAFGVLAWRVGKDFVCDEFCADGIEPTRINASEVKLQPHLNIEIR